jgi:methionyl-tRNA formyltransferase
MLSAAQITNRVRGFQPFPTAFTFYQNKKLTIWNCRPSEESYLSKNIGEVLEAKGDKWLIFCGGDSVLKIEELQLEGKRRMAVKDFLNGANIEVGDKLG